MKIIKSVNLEYIDETSDKVWQADLMENNDVLCSWGKMGTELQSKLFPNAGESFMNKKMTEKIRKGYELVEETENGKGRE